MRQDQMTATLARYKQELEDILSRFHKTSEGINIDQKDDARFREMVLELRDLFDDEFVDGRRHSRPLLDYFNDSISNWVRSPSFSGVESVKGVVASALARVQRNPLALRTAALEAKSRGVKDPDVIVTLAEHLHSVVRQLRERRENRPTLDVKDEYDVQDLFHALLTIHFDDIRKEEWTPSDAGAASRMDFLLPEIESVVEIKMTRPNLSAKQLGEQLIVDIAKYRKLLAQSQGITRLRGRWLGLALPGLDQPVPTLQMVHPSFLLRTPERSRDAWRDLLSLRARLDELLAVAFPSG